MANHNQLSSITACTDLLFLGVEGKESLVEIFLKVLPKACLLAVFGTQNLVLLFFFFFLYQPVFLRNINQQTF